MVSIRAYNPDSDGDLSAITAIYGHHVSFGRASFETEPPSLHDMRSRLAALVAEGYPALVAELDGEIAGYAYAGRHKAREAYRLTVEDSIYVHHDMARRGVGRALLAALIAECRAAGFRQMMAVIGDSKIRDQSNFTVPWGSVISERRAASVSNSASFWTWSTCSWR